MQLQAKTIDLTRLENDATSDVASMVDELEGHSPQELATSNRRWPARFISAGPKPAPPRWPMRFTSYQKKAPSRN
jgi:hypothetical protein